MIQLDLSTEEAHVLATILDQELSDLSYEIANTDSLDFRQKLKAKRVVMRKVLAALTADRQTA